MNRIATLKADVRVIIADDHAIFRDGLKQALASEENIFLVGEAADGKELVRLVMENKPDVILTDIRMPVMDGISAAKKILEISPDVSIVGLSMFDDEGHIVEMLEAGARGYLLKNADKSEIIDAINTVFQGDLYYCKHTSYTLAKMISSSKFNPHKRKEKIEFSERELEIIRLICEQLTNKEIAEKLYLSTRTVEGHRLKIQEKMHAKNTAGIVIMALKLGLYHTD
jgi:two-component system response regulator NreC